MQISSPTPLSATATRQAHCKKNYYPFLQYLPFRFFPSLFASAIPGDHYLLLFLSVYPDVFLCSFKSASSFKLEFLNYNPIANCVRSIQQFWIPVPILYTVYELLHETNGFAMCLKKMWHQIALAWSMDSLQSTAKFPCVANWWRILVRVGTPELN